jgi:hypothetical protein
MCTVRECADGGGIPTEGDMNHKTPWCDGGTHKNEPIELVVPGLHTPALQRVQIAAEIAEIGIKAQPRKP